MAKKGQTFYRYTPEFKAEAVRLYEKEKLGYKTIARMLGVKSDCQIRDWVTKYKQDPSFKDLRGKTITQRTGRPKTKFTSVEEELAYVKAERDYLKKQYPNLHGEVCPRRSGSK